MAGRHGADDFFDRYTKDLKGEDLQRLFTRDTRDAYHFFARNIDETPLKHLPPVRRVLTRSRLLFQAFTLTGAGMIATSTPSFVDM